MRPERGTASLPLLGVAALLVLLALLGVDVGRYLAARAQAVAAADAAALAAAPVTFRPFGAGSGPRAEAARFARANGARLLSCRCPLDRSPATRRVDVVVAVPVTLTLLGAREVRARSRAEFSPTRMLGAESRGATGRTAARDGAMAASAGWGHRAYDGSQQRGGAVLVERLVEVAALR
jgi:secretion/DNA translocation related TadE-like protein